MNKVVINTGMGMGSCMAMILSFSINKSILWMILHGSLGWIYVIYFAIVH